MYISKLGFSVCLRSGCKIVACDLSWNSIDLCFQLFHCPSAWDGMGLGCFVSLF